jgi:hypothetical protein
MQVMFVRVCAIRVVWGCASRNAAPQETMPARVPLSIVLSGADVGLSSADAGPAAAINQLIAAPANATSRAPTGHLLALARAGNSNSNGCKKGNTQRKHVTGRADPRKSMLDGAGCVLASTRTCA